MFFEFNENDIFRQTIVTYPSNNFMFLLDDDGEFKIFLNNPLTSGSAASIRTDSFNLTEINVDRTGSQVVYPFIDKVASQFWLAGMDSSSFHSTIWGGAITGSYLEYKTIFRDFITDNTHFAYKSLKNIWNSYNKLSSDFNFDNFPTGSSVLFIPRQYCQSSIKKGSVVASVYINNQVGASNTVSIHKAQDIYKDGILRIVQDGLPADNQYSTIGNKVGYVLYDHGIVLFHSGAIHKYDAVALQESIKISPKNFEWSSGSDNVYNWKWFSDRYFCNKEESLAFCSLEFQGTNKIENITMMCHARKGEINTSLNPTSVARDSEIFATQSLPFNFSENPRIQINNIISSSHNVSEEFQKQVYISKVYIYDKDRKLLGVAKLANPISKLENSDYTFKIGLDL